MTFVTKNKSITSSFYVFSNYDVIHQMTSYTPSRWCHYSTFRLWCHHFWWPQPLEVIVSSLYPCMCSCCRTPCVPLSPVLGFGFVSRVCVLQRVNLVALNCICEKVPSTKDWPIIFTAICFISQDHGYHNNIEYLIKKIFNPSDVFFSSKPLKGNF